MGENDKPCCILRQPILVKGSITGLFDLLQIAARTRTLHCPCFGNAPSATSQVHPNCRDVFTQAFLNRAKVREAPQL